MLVDQSMYVVIVCPSVDPYTMRRGKIKRYSMHNITVPNLALLELE